MCICILELSIESGIRCEATDVTSCLIVINTDVTTQPMCAEIKFSLCQNPSQL